MMNTKAKNSYCKFSHPTRVRGAKCLTCFVHPQLVGPPNTGAWVEKLIAPKTGAWIEMKYEELTS